MALQIRRGTEAERTAGGGIVFAQGELIYVTDTDALYIGDGATAGGILLSSDAFASIGEMLTANTTNPDSNLHTLELEKNLDLNGKNIVGAGNINIDGTITATGNINIGDDADTDTVDFTAKITSTLTPQTDSTYDIGTMSARWRNGYFAGLVVDGQIDAVTINADLRAADSTLAFDNNTGNFTGNLTGDVTGNVTGNVSGNVTGNLTGNSTGYHLGDVKGSIFGDDSTPLVDAVANRVNGDIYGDIFSANGDRILQNGIAGAADATFSGIVLGSLTGNVTGDVTGNVTGNVIGNVTGNLTGNVDGQLNGSVFSDSSTLLVDGVSGTIPASVISGTLTNDVVGSVTGNVITSLIDSSDSSAITIVPSATFNSAVAVDQVLTVGAQVGAQTVIQQRTFDNSDTVEKAGYVYTNRLASNPQDPIISLIVESGIEFFYPGAFYNGLSNVDGTLTLAGRDGNSSKAEMLLIQYTGEIGNEAQEDDENNYQQLAVINNDKADFITMPVKFPNMDSTTRDALTAEAGMVIFNTTTTKLQVCTVGGVTPTWVDLH